jgi:hypothetical protein
MGHLEFYNFRIRSGMEESIFPQTDEEGSGWSMQYSSRQAGALVGRWAFWFGYWIEL